MPRTTVTFKAEGFNTSESLEYFINPNNFGDDLGKWLQQEMRGRGVAVDDEVGQEDFGWYLTYYLAGKPFEFVFGYREEDSLWIGWSERSRGLILSLLGGRKRGVTLEAVQAVHACLVGSSRVSEILWHDAFAFEQGREEAGLAEPE